MCETLTTPKSPQYKSLSYLIFFAMTTALGGFNIGVVCNILNATILQIQKSLNWPDDEKVFRMGVASGVIPGGSLIGAVLAGYLSDKVGRRKALMISDIILLLGFIFTYCENFTLFCFGRAVEGIACGAFGVLVPIFIREIAPQSMSGKMVGAYSIGGSLGAILVYSLTFLLPITPTDDDQLWKYMYAIPAVVAALQLLIFLTALKFDSPKYYLIKNKEKEAKEVIKTIYKEEYVEEVFEREHQAERSHKLLDVVSKYRYPIMLCMFLYFTVQYMGTGMLGYYSTYIFLGTEGGDVQNTPTFMLEVRVLNLILALIGLSTSIIGSSLIDRFGRRIMLLLGSLGITILLFAFAAFGMNGNGFMQRISFVTLCIISGLAYGMVVAVYISEVVPPKGNSILNTWDNFNQQIITFLFPVIVNTPVKMNTAFIGFGLVGMLSLPVLWFFVKETKNKSLNEIYMMFRFRPKDEPLLKIYDEPEAITPAYIDPLSA